jgi:hypothetical protein
MISYHAVTSEDHVPIESRACSREAFLDRQTH